METNKNYKGFITVFAVTAAILFNGCMKEFLEIKRDKSQVIPESLEDFRSIFEDNTMNYTSPHLLGVIGSDDYYVQAQQWHALSDPIQKNAYVWAEEIYQGESGDDWNRGYEKILYANFVLEGVDGIGETPANKALRDEVSGAAYFFRGTNLFLLAQLFCNQYDAATASGDLGLPLRTTSNINIQYQRATLQDTYNQIIGDLQNAAALLPSQMSLNTRPYRAAALGMLSNVYLQTSDYGVAGQHADEALALAAEILDYNEVNTSLNLPFPQYGRTNKEIIFYSHMANAAILANARLTIDSVLFTSYTENDLRKSAFFFINGGRNAFKGSYSGSNSFMFSGLTTPELLLVRAECNARLGNIVESVADLNRLLENRFRPEHFAPVGIDIPQNELLQLVLSERRKELIYRGRRWHDLKRFEVDPNFSKPLLRVLDGMEYILPVNSPKWVWPIPPDVISLGGLMQNER